MANLGRRVWTAWWAAALVGAGCGGGDDRPSRADYVASVEEICAESDRRVQAVPEPETVADVARYGREIKSIIVELLAEARELELPDEDRERFEEYLDLVEADPTFDKMDDLIEAADAGDEDLVAELAAELENTGASEADELAAELGLDACATGVE